MKIVKRLKSAIWCARWDKAHRIYTIIQFIDPHNGKRFDYVPDYPNEIYSGGYGDLIAIFRVKRPEFKFWGRVKYYFNGGKAIIASAENKFNGL